MAHVIRFVSFTIAYLFIAIYQVSYSEETNYRNFELLRLHINPENDQHKHVMNILMGHQSQIDFWSQPSKLNPVADIALSPTLNPVIKRLFRKYDIPYTIVHEDIQKLIDGEKFEPGRKRRSTKEKSFNIREYNSHEKINDFMRDLAVKNPSFVSLINLNKTYEGRDLLGIRIGAPGNDKPSVWIDAAMHAREWIAPAAAIYTIYQMTSLFGRDRSITSLVTKYDWYFLPVANPDGYEYSRTHDRLWRKTRSISQQSRDEPNQLSYTSGRCVGVDANRNWGHHWGEAGANLWDHCSNIYAGTQSFSEIEVQSMKQFISRIPKLMVYLSLHSYGQIWLSPWGYSTIKPANYNNQQRAAEEALAAIENLSGKQYSFGAIADLMYPASGTSIDYMQSLGVPYSFAVELSPSDDDNNYGFFYPAEFIAPTGEELLAALKAVTHHVILTRRL